MSGATAGSWSRSVLVADGDRHAGRVLASALAADGCQTALATSPDEIERALAEHAYGVLLVDDGLVPPTDGSLLAWARRHRPDLLVLVMSQAPAVAAAVAALRAGAHDYLDKPVTAAVLRDHLASLRPAVSPRREVMLAALVEGLPDAVYLKDSAGRYLLANAGACRLVGRSLDEILGHDAHALFAPAEAERIIADDRRVLADADVQTQERQVTVHGVTRTFRTTRGPVRDAEGAVVGLYGIARDVTDQRQVEQALRRSEEQFHLIMDNLADLVAVLDLDGRRLYNSPSYQQILGDPHGLQGSDSFEEIHPDDRARVEQAFRDTVRTGVGQRLEYRLIGHDGRIRCIESQGSVIRDGDGQVAQVVVVSRDVTARRQADERLEASERKYRELVENANSIILHWARDGHIIFLNEYGQRFFGYRQDEIAGQHVVGTIVPETETGGRDLSRLLEAISADPAAFEQNVNENQKRSGERVWIAWTNKLVYDERGQVSEILSIGSDITARRQAEQALRAAHASLELRVAQRTAELAVARDRAEAADRIKSAFLASMSHELRTPLNSIIGFTGLLLQGLAGPLNDEQAKQLRMVKGSGQHLLALINDVLDISKIEAGQIDIACEPFDLPECIHKAVHTVLPLADQKGLALAVEVAPDLGAVSSDRRRVEQVLLNLLSNAVKFTEHGQVTLTAGVEPGPPAQVTVAVADTGLGIAEADLGQLFQPFRQLDTGLTRQHEGTGLGLAICKRLVDRLGGTIAVASTPGQGSTFTFTLPLDPEDGR